MSATGQNQYFRALVIAVPALMIYIMELMELLGGTISFIGLTALLQVYLIREVMAVRGAHPQRWFLNPVIFCGLLTFTLGYGVTNVVYFVPQHVRAALGMDVDISPAMVKLMFLGLTAAIAMFLGYWSSAAASLSSERSAGRFRHLMMRGLDVPRMMVIVGLLGLSVVARIYAISLGFYGYGGDYSIERVAATSSYSQFIGLASSGGMLALILAALAYYRVGKNSLTTAMLVATITVEMLFGLLSGMKSTIVLPIVVPIICSYLVRGRISKIWVGGTIAVIFLSYMIVEPFRVARNDEAGALTSSRAIVELLMSDTDNSAVSDTAIGWRILSRANLSYIGSIGIQYADDNEQLSSTAPAFLGDLLLAPAHALIPRAIWTSKPLGTLGFWYTQEVMGLDLISSTGMGPLTYLYFAGGFLVVVIFFFCLGIVQRWLWFALAPWTSLSGATIYLSIVTVITALDSSANNVLLSLVRLLPLMFILCRILFRPAGIPAPQPSPANYALDFGR